MTRLADRMRLERLEPGHDYRRLRPRPFNTSSLAGPRARCDHPGNGARLGIDEGEIRSGPRGRFWARAAFERDVPSRSSIPDWKAGRRRGFRPIP